MMVCGSFGENRSRQGGRHGVPSVSTKTLEYQQKVDVSWIMGVWFDVEGVGLPKVQPAAERVEPPVRPMRRRSATEDRQQM